MTYEPYATPDALSTFLGVAVGSLPADTDRLLVRASTLIDSIPTLKAFDIDTTTGIPSDGDVAAAMSSAVCAQIEYWFEIGGGPDGDGEEYDILRPPRDQTIGTVAFPHLSKYAPRAVDVLRSVGLLSSGVEQAGAPTVGFFG